MDSDDGLEGAEWSSDLSSWKQRRKSRSSYQHAQDLIETVTTDNEPSQRKAKTFKEIVESSTSNTDPSISQGQTRQHGIAHYPFNDDDDVSGLTSEVSKPNQSLPDANRNYDSMDTGSGTAFQSSKTDTNSNCTNGSGKKYLEKTIKISQRPNHEKGFGFSVTKGAEPNAPVVIESIVRGGTADILELKNGDEILMVDGADVANHYIGSVQAVINQAISVGQLELRIRRLVQSNDDLEEVFSDEDDEFQMQMQDARRQQLPSDSLSSHAVPSANVDDDDDEPPPLPAMPPPPPDWSTFPSPPPNKDAIGSPFTSVDDKKLLSDKPSVNNESDAVSRDELLRKKMEFLGLKPEESEEYKTVKEVDKDKDARTRETDLFRPFSMQSTRVGQGVNHLSMDKAVDKGLDTKAKQTDLAQPFTVQLTNRPTGYGDKVVDKELTVKQTGHPLPFLSHTTGFRDNETRSNNSTGSWRNTEPNKLIVPEKFAGTQKPAAQEAKPVAEKTVLPLGRSVGLHSEPPNQPLVITQKSSPPVEALTVATDSRESQPKVEQILWNRSPGDGMDIGKSWTSRTAADRELEENRARTRTEDVKRLQEKEEQLRMEQEKVRNESEQLKREKERLIEEREAQRLLRYVMPSGSRVQNSKPPIGSESGEKSSQIRNQPGYQQDNTKTTAAGLGIGSKKQDQTAGGPRPFRSNSQFEAKQPPSTVIQRQPSQPGAQGAIFSDSVFDERQPSDPYVSRQVSLPGQSQSVGYSSQPFHDRPFAASSNFQPVNRLPEKQFTIYGNEPQSMQPVGQPFERQRSAYGMGPPGQQDYSMSNQAVHLGNLSERQPGGYSAEPASQRQYDVGGQVPPYQPVGQPQYDVNSQSQATSHLFQRQPSGYTKEPFGQPSYSAQIQPQPPASASLNFEKQPLSYSRQPSQPPASTSQNFEKQPLSYNRQPLNQQQNAPNSQSQPSKPVDYLFEKNPAGYNREQEPSGVTDQMPSYQPISQPVGGNLASQQPVGQRPHDSKSQFSHTDMPVQRQTGPQRGQQLSGYGVQPAYGDSKQQSPYQDMDLKHPKFMELYSGTRSGDRNPHGLSQSLTSVNRLFDQLPSNRDSSRYNMPSQGLDGIQKPPSVDSRSNIRIQPGEIPPTAVGSYNPSYQSGSGSSSYRDPGDDARRRELESYQYVSTKPAVDALFSRQTGDVRTQNRGPDQSTRPPSVSSKIADVNSTGISSFGSRGADRDRYAAQQTVGNQPHWSADPAKAPVYHTSSSSQPDLLTYFENRSPRHQPGYNAPEPVTGPSKYGSAQSLTMSQLPNERVRTLTAAHSRSASNPLSNPQPQRTSLTSTSQDQSGAVSSLFAHYENTLSRPSEPRDLESSRSASRSQGSLYVPPPVAVEHVSRMSQGQPIPGPLKPPRLSSSGSEYTSNQQRSIPHHQRSSSGSEYPRGPMSYSDSRNYSHDSLPSQGYGHHNKDPLPGSSSYRDTRNTQDQYSDYYRGDVSGSRSAVDPRVVPDSYGKRAEYGRDPYGPASARDTSYYGRDQPWAAVPSNRHEAASMMPPVEMMRTPVLYADNDTTILCSGCRRTLLEGSGHLYGSDLLCDSCYRNVAKYRQ